MHGSLRNYIDDTEKLSPSIGKSKCSGALNVTWYVASYSVLCLCLPGGCRNHYYPCEALNNWSLAK